MILCYFHKKIHFQDTQNIVLVFDLPVKIHIRKGIPNLNSISHLLPTFKLV